LKEEIGLIDDFNPIITYCEEHSDYKWGEKASLLLDSYIREKISKIK
jgi:hypothetical protein